MRFVEYDLRFDLKSTFAIAIDQCLCDIEGERVSRDDASPMTTTGLGIASQVSLRLE